jgi:hypothetical protein
MNVKFLVKLGKSEKEIRKMLNISKFCMVLALYLCDVWISEQTAAFFPYSSFTDWFGITKVESVYCAVHSQVLT